MMGDHDDLEDILEASLTQLGPEPGPKLSPVIDQEAGTYDQPGEN
jgi:hypothetical protein